ncbi:CDP-alcohol phosphatidyltransferase family protein [Dactylosporangium sp. CA-139066]|uniref:CDP-alcohol phosphatidyltransferase family protein n=1 Tax=Dactylosporangium sp. CA-139066 TaxID=3239930 RepID=UPI003D9483C1
MRGRPDPLPWDGYCDRWSTTHGGYDPRRSPSPVRGWLRLCHRIGAALARRGVRSPDAVTTIGVLASAVVPVLAFLAPRAAPVAALLVLLTAFADTIDGVLAVVADRATRLGHVYDATADRVTEALWLVAFAALGAPPWLAASCGAVMWLHEYVRARASVAGMTGIGTVTIAERPTRVLIAMFGLLVAPLDTRAATVTLAIALAVSLIGFAQLIAAVRRALR